MKENFFLVNDWKNIRSNLVIGNSKATKFRSYHLQN